MNNQSGISSRKPWVGESPGNETSIQPAGIFRPHADDKMQQYASDWSDGPRHRMGTATSGTTAR